MVQEFSRVQMNKEADSLVKKSLALEAKGSFMEKIEFVKETCLFFLEYRGHITAGTKTRFEAAIEEKLVEAHGLGWKGAAELYKEIFETEIS